MAKALQHNQAALIARISTACATDNEPIPDTARSGRANAIVSQSRWYKKSVRSNRFSRSARLSASSVESPTWRWCEIFQLFIGLLEFWSFEQAQAG
jgi:hypothetical protein